jgi:hypothetical protein
MKSTVSRKDVEDLETQIAEFQNEGQKKMN